MKHTVTLDYGDVLALDAALIGAAYRTELDARRLDRPVFRRKADKTLKLLNTFRAAAGIGSSDITAEWLMGEEE